jgi:hypothetical protein
MVGTTVDVLNAAVDRKAAGDTWGSLSIQEHGGPLVYGTHVRVIKTEGDYTQIKALNNRWFGQYLWAKTGDLVGLAPGDPRKEEEELAKRMQWKQAENDSEVFQQTLESARAGIVIRTAAPPYDKGHWLLCGHVAVGDASKARCLNVAIPIYKAAREHINASLEKGLVADVELSFYVKPEDEKQGNYIGRVSVTGAPLLPEWSNDLMSWNLPE